MANAEGEKLELLREYRLSQEKFYYNLSILSGGTLSIIATLITVMKGLINDLGSCSIIFLWLSIGFMIISFALAIFRNLFAPSSIKNIAQNEKITEYKELIQESSEEKCYIKVLSYSSIFFFFTGLLIFTFIAMLALSSNSL